jgi:DNA-binding LacI/PurR family transcriptional regulator
LRAVCNRSKKRLTKAGKTLLVASSGYDPAREREQMEALISRGADGLLLIGSARPDSSIEYLRRRGVPYVGAWNLGGPDGYFVGFDNARRRLETDREGDCTGPPAHCHDWWHLDHE